MGDSEGMGALKTMLKREISDNHFRFLSETEAQEILTKPHNFFASDCCLEAGFPQHQGETL